MSDREIFGVLLVGSQSTTIQGICNRSNRPLPDSVLVADSLGPELYHAIVAASAVICSSGGLAGHMQSLCRSRGIPILRIETAELEKLFGQLTIHLGRQSVVLGELSSPRPPLRPRAVGIEDLGDICVVIADATDISSINGLVPRLASANCFFIREEFLCLSAGLRPLDSMRAGPARARSYGTAIGELLCEMVKELLPEQRLVMRLLDLRSDDAGQLSVEVDVDREANPELGLHGARWLVEERYYPQAFAALRAHVEQRLGPDAAQLTFAVPFVNDSREFVRLRRHLAVPSELRLSVFIETPAAVHSTADFCAAGASELFVGTKDLVQFYLAADRGNHLVASSYQTRHPAVIAGLRHLVESARRAGTPAYVFALGADIYDYVVQLPPVDGFMVCTAELKRLADEVRRSR